MAEDLLVARGIEVTYGGGRLFGGAGHKVLHDAGIDDLENYAKKSELVIVAAGKGDIARLFERDAEKSPFDEPQRALALTYVNGMAMYSAKDGLISDFHLVHIGSRAMATGIDAVALLTYRAAWRRDVQQLPTTKEAAMAKMTATETAQAVIDRAVQLFGGRGVKSGEITEKLYREIRALRIYEGATEVQKLIVARELMKGG